MTAPQKLHFVSFLIFLISAQMVLAQDQDPRFVEGEQLIVGLVEGANMFQVYSKEVGEWTSVSFPDGIEATPIVGRGVCTFNLEGEKISQLVAVDVRGNCVKFDLPKPTTLCKPIVSGNLAVFVIDGRTYAFSAVIGRWDAIESGITPRVSDDVALIVMPDWIGAFSAKTGKWSVAKTKIKTAHP